MNTSVIPQEAQNAIKEHFNTEDLLNKLNIYNTEN